MSRRRLRPAAAGLGLLLAGCVSRPEPPAPPEPFVFRSLNLRQQDKNGAPAWTLTSPEARYDISRRLAQARQPKGVIYVKGQPRYRIAASSGTVIGDGQAIQLEGAVTITLLGPSPVRISGDQVRWLPAQNLMLIDRRPMATDRQSRLRARSARFLIAEDRIELRGTATLEQWPGGGQPKPQAARGAAPLRLSTAQVDWKPNEGSLVAPQAARGERRQGSGSQILTARGLKGNLRQGYVDLLAPVRLVDRQGQGWLQAQQTRWAINDQTLTTSQPFRGQFKALAAQGAALLLDLRQETATIPAACALQQPGETLNAQRCLWHWPSGRFTATGDVLLRRQTYRQITRSSSLEGQIGKDGTAVFRSPGAKVLSQFTLPPRQAGSGSGSPRPAGPPVTF